MEKKLNSVMTLENWNEKLKNNTLNSYFRKKLNKEQLEVIDNLNGIVLVLAGPGSGKTRIIVYAVKKLLLLEGVRPEEIMMVTFTNKAKDSMKAKVEKKLGKLPIGILAGTFHAIGLKFIHEYQNYIFKRFKEI